MEVMAGKASQSPIQVQVPASEVPNRVMALYPIRDEGGSKFIHGMSMVQAAAVL